MATVDGSWAAAPGVGLVIFIQLHVVDSGTGGTLHQPRLKFGYLLDSTVSEDGFGLGNINVFKLDFHHFGGAAGPTCLTILKKKQ